MPTPDFTSALNPEQYAAVTAPDGPVLILAAAGTGKTRTLVYRVAYLLDQGIAPDRILLLTFTNRAAREMLERTQKLVARNVSGMWGGTFHHMANRVLRRHADSVGYGADYTIMDRDDSLKLLDGCVKDRKPPTDFPKPEVLMSLFSAAANTETPLAETIEARLGQHPVDPADIVAIHKAYASRKRALNAMDFDDLLVLGLKLFREHPEILKRYQEQFRHVLVDEYQDTNTIQAEWVDRIAGLHRNIVVVGDDFQSIYAWRGANYRNIMSFPQRYPDARIFMLETNYRSVPEVLDVANACIAGNPHQFQKKLRSMREAYRRPILARVRDGDAQARYVVEQIRRLKRSGYRASQIAVLYRAHFHSMELQMQLARERIPHVVTSGARFFEQTHVKDVCALVRILHNPGDELAFARLMALLPKVGDRTAARVWKNLGGAFHAAHADALRALRESLPDAAVPSWRKIEPICEAYEPEDLKSDPGEVIHRFVQEFYDDYAKNNFENAERRLDDIHELVLFTTKFETTEQFLSDMALLTNLDAEAANGADDADSIRLTTVHQAKGLEWSAVIVLWATEGMFPSARVLNESVEGESEERRLFYVAVTRAKDELILCAPEVRRTHEGGVIFCAPSRFVTEIPADLLEQARVGFI